MGRRFRFSFGFDLDAAAGGRRARSHRISIGAPSTTLVRSVQPDPPRGPYGHLRASARFVVEGLFRREQSRREQKRAVRTRRPRERRSISR